MHRFRAWIEGLSFLVAMPVRFGSSSVAHGQDIEGDLRNDHRIDLRAPFRHAPSSDPVHVDGFAAERGHCRFVRNPAIGSSRPASTRRAAARARGFHIDVGACRVHDTWIGAGAFPYRSCPVRVP